MDWTGMDGELLIKFIPYSRVIRKDDCVQNIIRKDDGSAIGEWQRYVILPAKIKQKVSFYLITHSCLILI
jgi:hypothetical protein